MFEVIFSALFLISNPTLLKPALLQFWVLWPGVLWHFRSWLGKKLLVWALDHLIVALGVCTIFGLVVYHMKGWLVKYSHTSFVKYVCPTQLAHFEELRRRFRKLVIPKTIVPANHSHGASAGLRTAINKAISNFCAGNELELFALPKTSRDSTGGEARHGILRLAQLATIKLSSFFKTASRPVVVKMIDSDYFVDMTDQLTSYFTPHILNTFDPKTAGGQTQEGLFRFDGDKVVLDVHGGARYEHHLWDYNTDVLTIVEPFRWLRPWTLVFPTTYVYSVEKLATEDRDRTVIGLFPLFRTLLPIWIENHKQLRRRSVSKGDYSAVVSFGQVEPQVSFALNGEPSSVTVPIPAFCSLYARLQAAHTPHISDIERVLRAYKMPVEEATVGAAVFHRIWTNIGEALELPKEIVAWNSRNEEKIRDISYEFEGPLVFEDAKESVRIVGPMYCDVASAPRKGLNSDAACVEGRIEMVRAHVASMPQDLIGFGNEFAEFLIPAHKVGTFVPVDGEIIATYMTRPTQRRDIIRNLPWSGVLPSITVKSFQKGETYGKTSDPRNISTLPTDHKLRYAGYIYAFVADTLKHTIWYAFGRKPDEVVRQVTGICQCESVIPTDFSRFDGTHSRPLVEYENALLKRAFPSEYHGEIDELQLGQYNTQGKTSFGVAYDIGDTRLSGSSDTSCFNSTDNAFVAYSTLRRCGLTPEKAWTSLGVYGGDDGLTPFIPTDQLACNDGMLSIYEKTATDLGLKLKAEVVSTEGPVTFLGRTYLQPRFSSDHMCDLTRIVPKLGCTNTGKQIPAMVALRAKASGLIISDQYTPFVGEYARSIIRLTRPTENPDKFDLMADRPYNLYVQEENLSDLAYEVAARQLNTDVTDIREYEEKLRTAKSLRDLDLGIIFSGLKRPDPVGVYFRDILIGEPTPDITSKYKHVTPTRIQANQSAPVDRPLRCQPRDDQAVHTSTAVAGSVDGGTIRSRGRNPGSNVVGGVRRDSSLAPSTGSDRSSDLETETSYESALSPNSPYSRTTQTTATAVSSNGKGGQTRVETEGNQQHRATSTSKSKHPPRAKTKSSAVTPGQCPETRLSRRSKQGPKRVIVTRK